MSMNRGNSLKHSFRLFAVATCLTLLLFASDATAKWPSCHTMSGSLAEVMARMNWNDALPITLFGIPVVPGNGNPPRLHEDPLCHCHWRTPGLSAIPFGIGMTFWNPMYIVEVSKAAGCFITLPVGGILDGYENESSGKQTSSGRGEHYGQRRQIHFYVSPIFKMLDLFAETFCAGENSVFDLAYVTEIDPVWQNDLWSSTFFPGGSIFANVASRMACLADAAKVNIARSYPIDALWWCAGADHLYPPSGNSNVTSSSEETNMKALARFLFRQHRMGALSTTIGKAAECYAHYSPVLPKQQYRVDPVYPSAVNNVPKPIVLGRKYLFWKFPPPVFNYGSHESAVFVLWRGTQCCLRF